jgi:DNA-binding Lrp family transcriptional regulator
LIQGDIPLTARPFAAIGEAVGSAEEEVLAIVRGFAATGIIRKFAAIVRHQQVGYTHNVMVVWAVPPALAEEAGAILAGFAAVTHCYERNPPLEGRYNLFTMVHFQSRDDEALLRQMAAAAGVSDFRVLRSLEEFKKNSMEYFR